MSPEKFRDFRETSPWRLFLESPKTFRAREDFRKIATSYLLKLVFSYVVKGIKIKITSKFRALRRLSLALTKRTMSPKMRPKSFGTFEKRAPGR